MVYICARAIEDSKYYRLCVDVDGAQLYQQGNMSGLVMHNGRDYAIEPDNGQFIITDTSTGIVLDMHCEAIDIESRIKAYDAAVRRVPEPHAAQARKFKAYMETSLVRTHLIRRK